MNMNNRTPAIIIGLALFAMFFGSGNLIYPLHIGVQAQSSWLSAALGFLVAAVLLPFLGVIAMVLYRGSYAVFFQSIGKRAGFALCLLLLTVWIPLGSAPRCMILAFSSLHAYAGVAPPLWVFALFYSYAVFVVVSKNLGVLDILGKWITPLLLICVVSIGYQGVLARPNLDLFHPFDLTLFQTGLFEGYNTMDLIASFFFSASVIHILTRSGSSIATTLPLVFRSSIIGVFVLALVYVCLIWLSANYSTELESIPKDQLLAYLAQFILGTRWSFLAILAILLACFSTSVALIIAYADFLDEQIFKKSQHPNLPIVLALVVTFVMSLFGLEGVTFATAPVLKICYPILLVLILYNITKFTLSGKKEPKPASLGAAEELSR